MRMDERMIPETEHVNVQGAAETAMRPSADTRPMTARELARSMSANKARPPKTLLPNLKLIQARERYGLSQPTVASAVGVSTSSLIYYEKGFSAPSVRIAIKLARFFETSVEDLFGSLVDDEEAS